MIDAIGRRPHNVVVTVFAYIAGVDVCRVLAGCAGAVVATRAIAGNIDMIEIRRNPADGCVAVAAIIATCYMRRVLAGRGGTIVA